jgi:hypothetical protein
LSRAGRVHSGADYEWPQRRIDVLNIKFRDHVRSKTPVAMVNEVLCKIICHNICCLIQESHELGIDPAFWARSPNAQQVTLN